MGSYSNSSYSAEPDDFDSKWVRARPEPEPPHLRSVMECFWEDMYASVLKDDLITSFRIEVSTNWGTFVDSIRIYNTDLKQNPDLYGWVLERMVREIDWNLNMAPEKELGQ
jgi:hypothetical protein